MATGTKITAIDLAAQLLAKKGDPTAMLKIARRGARLYPTEVLPGGATFANLAEQIAAHMPTAESAQRPAPAKKAAPAQKAAPQKAAPQKAAPQPEPAPKVETTTLTLVHDGESQTAIFGVEKDTPAHRALGKKASGGLGWGFWFPNRSWYLRGTQGFAPNMPAIREAVARLESITEGGVQLYRVEQKITTTDASGNPLPEKRTREQAAAWQKAYDSAFNGGNWALSVSKGVCNGCGVEGLDVHTGRLIKDGDGIPRVNCATCGHFDAPKPEPVAESVPAPVAELAALVEALALPAADVHEDCHACKTRVAVVDGQYAMHGDPRGGACRAKRGVVSDDPIVDEEPVVKAAPRTRRSRKPSAADLGIVVTPATGLTITLQLQTSLSGMQVKAAATEVRQVLPKAIKGVKIETRRDKDSKRLVLTVVEGGESFDADALTDQIVTTAKRVRGVANRVHAA